MFERAVAGYPIVDRARVARTDSRIPGRSAYSGSMEPTPPSRIIPGRACVSVGAHRVAASRRVRVVIASHSGSRAYWLVRAAGGSGGKTAEAFCHWLLGAIGLLVLPWTATGDGVEVVAMTDGGLPCPQSPMSVQPVAVLIHVPDVDAGMAWYREAFPTAVPQETTEPGLGILDLGPFAIEIVRADAKVGAGRAGTVLYWGVDDLDAAMARLERIGATLYRGPLPVAGDVSMCQMADPFGNLIGLRGRRADEGSAIRR